MLGDQHGGALGQNCSWRFAKTQHAYALLKITKHQRSEVSVDGDDGAAFGVSEFQDRAITWIAAAFSNGHNVMTLPA
jgi:hypothetical protein